MPTDRLFAIVVLVGAVLSFPGSGAAKPAEKDNWGEAFRQTLAAQIIDPNPQYDTAVPKTSGEQAAAAVQRYRTDKVKRPDKISSSTVGRQSASNSN